jgi:hypothetical protein
MNSDNNGTVANICSPALVYLCFSLIQIIIDVYKKQFNTAFFKFWVMIIFTTLLNILCERGLGVISWLIVFVPIIMMTIIIFTLIYFLGFNPGQANKIFNVENAKPLQPQFQQNNKYIDPQNGEYYGVTPYDQHVVDRMYELTNMVMEEHIAKMEDINKKTPTEETVETSEIETTTKEIETTTKEISESGDNLINSSEAFSLF